MQALKAFRQQGVTLNEEFIIPLDVDTDFDDDFLNHVTGVNIEISNTCNLAHLHSECPCSWYTKKFVLDKAIVFKVIDSLASVKFNGKMMFSRYNEPMLNKHRLYEFVEYTNCKIPNAKIQLLTNGTLLNQNDIVQLEKFKIHTLAITAYDKNTYNRLAQIKTKLPVRIFKGKLDDRENIYTRKPLNCIKPCYATIRDVTINSQGQVSLCCLDWDNRETFGDLHINSLQEILNSPRFLETHKKLTHGERFLEICKRCDWQR